LETRRRRKADRSGEETWQKVGRNRSGRTNVQCRNRWINNLDPANEKKGQWTPEEDATLMEAMKMHGKDCWAVVATLVPGRADKQCRSRWVQTLDHANVKKGQWTPEEDAKLAESVKKHGKNWVAVAKLVPGRTNEQCRARWVQTLDPANGKKGKWKPEEDAKLTEAVKKHGKKWVAIAATVAGRTDKQCRNRWTQALDPANWKKGGWTPEEYTKLTAAVKEHGKHWVEVAAMVPGRTDEQCRGRWVQTLDPDRAPNTVEEEHDDCNDEALVSILV
jgi:hypothetical protein